MSTLLHDLEEHGLLSGRMVHSSKSTYGSLHPDNEVFFNACIFAADNLQQIWWGDIDLTVSDETLKALAALGHKFYVTRESVYRWDGLTKKDAKTARKKGEIRNDYGVLLMRYYG
jgi:hypothetical protein